MNHTIFKLYDNLYIFSDVSNVFFNGTIEVGISTVLVQMEVKLWVVVHKRHSEVVQTSGSDKDITRG